MPNCLLKLCVSLVLIFSSLLAIAADSSFYEIIIIKSKRLLILKQGSQLIKKYRVALGRGGSGRKYLEGDRHTPEGEYEVVAFRPSRKFHYFIQLNYPSRQDAMAGFKKGLISREELTHIYRAHQEQYGIPPQRTPLGGFIGIHGIGRETREKLLIHRYFNWTRGCVALTNNEVDELRQFMSLGTKVTIFDQVSDKEIFMDVDKISNISSAD